MGRSINIYTVYLYVALQNDQKWAKSRPWEARWPKKGPKSELYGIPIYGIDIYRLFHEMTKTRLERTVYTDINGFTPSNIPLHFYDQIYSIV